MSWFNRILNESADVSRRDPTEVFEALTPDPDQLRSFAQQTGLELVKNDQGEFLMLPPDFDVRQNPNFISNFVDYWLGSPAHSAAGIEAERRRKYQQYRTMDMLLGEASLTLNTYADEAISLGFIDDPLEITIKGSAEADKIVRDVLDRSGFFENTRSHIRNLAKWGDLGFFLQSQRAQDVSALYVESKIADQFEAITASESRRPVAWVPTLQKVGQQSSSRERMQNKRDVWWPWMFTVFTLADDEYLPYGRSMLDPMTNVFDQLLTIEALLALSRASRVERLIIKLPVGGDNPVTAMSKLNRAKSAWKNLIYTDSSQGQRTYSKTPALTDVLFMPSDDGFSIDKLQSSIDISSTEDVEYFRDKAMMMTGLPKGYYNNDGTTDRGQALQSQDLKFARKLIPLQTAYCNGVLRLIYTILLYSQVPIKGLEVEVRMRRPPQINKELISEYADLIERVAGIVDSHAERSTHPVDKEEMYKNLLAAFGLPEEIISLFTSSDHSNEVQVHLSSLMNDSLIVSSRSKIARSYQSLSQSSYKADHQALVEKHLGITRSSKKAKQS
jgi:hypothetical protein